MRKLAFFFKGEHEILYQKNIKEIQREKKVCKKKNLPCFKYHLLSNETDFFPPDWFSNPTDHDRDIASTIR